MEKIFYIDKHSKIKFINILYILSLSQRYCKKIDKLLKKIFNSKTLSYYELC